MQKTHFINLDGQSFIINEDAYELLESYLSTIGRQYSDEGLHNIESQIAISAKEKLGERTILTIDDVRQLIRGVKVPEGEINSNSQYETERDSNRSTTDSFESERVKHNYYREMNNAMLCGVLSGLSAYTGWNLMAIRAIVVVLAILSINNGFIWLIIIAYLAVWMIVPPTITVSDQLRLKGKPLDTENYEHTLSNEAQKVEPRYSDIRRSLGCVFKGLLVATVIVAIVIVVFTLIGDIFGLFNWLSSFLPHDYYLTRLPHEILVVTSISALLVFIIPLIILLIGSGHKADGTPKKGINTFRFVSATIWFLAIVTLILCFIVYATNISFDGFFFPIY